MVLMPKQAKMPSARDYPIQPPVRGWIKTEMANAKPGGALRLDNFFPTQTSIRTRGGRLKHATIGSDPVLRLWTYESGGVEEFFASDDTNIYDITSPASTTVAPTASVTGQTSGYYSVSQFGTAGGDYLYAVNGTDPALLYDGTDFYPTTDEAIYGLAYDAGSADFTVGQSVAGGTSGASATIVKVDGDTTSGTLWIKAISGTFQDNEALSGGSGGSATSNIPSGVTTISAVTISGVDTSTLDFVWSFASRLFFIQKDSLSVWYLPVDSLGGTAQEFNLSGVMQAGGTLVFGAKWSLDSGDGLDDKWVVMSDKGEIAVYQGTNPGSAADWSKVGIYRIAPPMGPNCQMQAGGDLLIGTEDGIVPISQAVNKDAAALKLFAVTKNIEPEWRKEVNARGALPWEIIKWPTNSWMVVSLPVTDVNITPQCFVANLETGAWAGPFTNWDTRSLALFGGRGYFGSSTGTIHAMDTTGSDDGEPYTCVYVGLPDAFKSPGQFKTFTAMRAYFQSNVPFTPKLSASVNFNVSLPSSPASIAEFSADVWDSGLWDEATWDAGSEVSLSSKWVSLGRSGQYMMPQLQITFGITATPKTELIAMDTMYVTGAVMV
jgi:hypothetical protein